MEQLFPNGKIDKQNVKVIDNTFYYKEIAYDLFPVESDIPFPVVGILDDQDFDYVQLVDPDGNIKYYTPNNILAKERKQL